MDSCRTHSRHKPNHLLNVAQSSTIRMRKPTWVFFFVTNDLKFSFYRNSFTGTTTKFSREYLVFVFLFPIQLLELFRRAFNGISRFHSTFKHKKVKWDWNDFGTQFQLRFFILFVPCASCRQMRNETSKKATEKTKSYSNNWELGRMKSKNHACDVIFIMLSPWCRHPRRRETTAHENKQHICRLLESSNCSKKTKAKHQDQKEIADFRHSTWGKKQQHNVKNATSNDERKMYENGNQWVTYIIIIIRFQFLWSKKKRGTARKISWK